MSLKAQDLLILLKLVSINHQPWTYASLSEQLGMSSSQLHTAAKRIVAAKLASKNGRDIIPNVSNLKEFLLHGVKYIFVPEKGEITRGILTSHAAPPLADLIIQDEEPPPVWPDPDGKSRGYAFSPLHKLVPHAIKLDPKLYELLVLVDALRGGRARERKIATAEITKRLDFYGRA